MIHSGTKPFLCLIDKCTSRYSQRGNLKVPPRSFGGLTKMHQNKFHTETIQRLKDKIEASGKGGPQLDEYEKELAEHLKILYKFANKGIRGRGKKMDSEPATSPVLSERAGSDGRDVPEFLPPPVLIPRGTEGSLFGGSTTLWNRNDRTMSEDVFVGNQGHTQTNFMGGLGDGNAGIGGYSFGSMG
jgi:hypothetical protein